MPLEQKAAGGRVHGKLEADSADRPSQWREKYGSTSCATIDSSVTDWIATMRDNSKIGAPISKTYFESLATDGASTDEDVADVISQMNKLLDGVLPSRYTNFDTHDVDIHEKPSFDTADAFDTKFTSYLQDTRETLIGSHEEAFTGESMAILFRRSHDEKLTKKCFFYLLKHTKENRLLRCRVFAGWERVAIIARGGDDVLISKFRKHHKCRHIRRLFSSWLNLAVIARDIVKSAVQIRVRKMSREILIAWNELSRGKKSRSAEHIRKINSADNFRNTTLTRLSFIGWLTSTRENGEHDVSGTRSVVSPTNPGQPITPEKVILAHSEAKDTSAKRIMEKIQLIPANSQRGKAGISSRTSNIVLTMNQRKMEREKRRAMLRQRYEQKSTAKLKWLEEQKHRREEREMKVHREFVQHRKHEAQMKKMADEHMKRACRLAALHYRMSLQKRMLIQWKQVFRIQDFRERKSSIAWSDTTYEKCWRGWLLFKMEAQRKMRTYQERVDDFNKRRLLAKAFASLEEHVNFSKSLLLEATSRVLAHRRRSILTLWLGVTNREKTERCVRVNKAEKKGFGARLTLSIAIKSWRTGAKNCQREREIDLLVEAKWKQLGLCRAKIG